MPYWIGDITILTNCDAFHQRNSREIGICLD